MFAELVMQQLARSHSYSKPSYVAGPFHIVAQQLELE